jgi:hypothetical protein
MALANCASSRRHRSKLALAGTIFSAYCGLVSGNSPSGVIREARLLTPLAPECVQRVIAGTPGITTLDHHHDEFGQVTTVSGRTGPQDVIDNYSYRGDESSHVVGVFKLSRHFDGRVEISDALTSLTGSPPQADIDASRPVMVSLESAIESRCGARNLSKRIKERCEGVMCRALGPSPTQ